MNSRAFGQLLILGALWGAAFMFMRIAVPEFGAVATAGVRVALACAIMLAVVLAMRLPFPLRTHWKRYVAVGGVNTAIPFIMYCFAALHIPSAYSAIGNSTTPIWGALIAWLFMKEKLGVLKWVGIVAAFAGVVALVGLQPVDITPMIVAGMIAVLVGAMMYAAASFLIKRYLSDDGGIVGATGMVFGATLWLVPIALFAVPTKMPPINAWGAVLALAVLCTVVGYFLFFKLIREIGPQRASSVAFLFPAFAAFWGWLFLDEPITANMLIGMALVLIGTALVSASAEKLRGGANRIERALHTLVLPIVIGIVPQSLRCALVKRASRSERLFRDDANATIAAIKRWIPGRSCDRLAYEYRLNRLADLSDFWLSWFHRNPRSLPKVHVADGVAIEPRALWVTYHFGAGWWIASFLHRQGLAANLLIKRPDAPTGWIDRLARHMGIFRNEHFASLVRAPLIWSNEAGAALKMRTAWREGRSVIALSDLPAQAGDRAASATFFEREARFPSAVFSLAHAAHVPVYLFLGRWNAESCQPELHIELLAAANVPVAEALRQYVSRLEQEIRKSPAHWHVWPSIDDYFVRAEP
jgi:drug/metabolite transporter (DMT)-like permease